LLAKTAALSRATGIAGQTVNKFLFTAGIKKQ